MLDNNGNKAIAVGMQNGDVFIHNGEDGRDIQPLAEDETKTADAGPTEVRTVALTSTDNQTLVCTSTYMGRDRYCTWFQERGTFQRQPSAKDAFALHGGNEIVKCSSKELRFNGNMYELNFPGGLQDAAISPSKTVAAVIAKRPGKDYGELHMFNTQALLGKAPHGSLGSQQNVTEDTMAISGVGFGFIPDREPKAGDTITGEADGPVYRETIVKVKLSSNNALITTIQALYNPAEEEEEFWERVKDATSKKIGYEQFIVSDKKLNKGEDPELFIKPYLFNAGEFYQKLADNVGFTRRGRQ